MAFHYLFSIPSAPLISTCFLFGYAIHENLLTAFAKLLLFDICMTFKLLPNVPIDMPNSILSSSNFRHEPSPSPYSLEFMPFNNTNHKHHEHSQSQSHIQSVLSLNMNNFSKKSQTREPLVFQNHINKFYSISKQLGYLCLAQDLAYDFDIPSSVTPNAQPVIEDTKLSNPFLLGHIN